MGRTVIRLLKTHEEYRACERLQEAVWGTLGVGSEVLSVTQKYGGVVLGAIADGKVVGFIYAFLARYYGRLVHWSHMMAVEAGQRDKGLGLRMKLAHRKLALQRGIASICWTYDPLQSRNATLNLHRLGARVEEYVRDCYGHFPSAIEKGLPSDRFVVDWHIGSARVERFLNREARPPDLSLPRVNETRVNARGFVANRSLRFDMKAPRLLVEIPTNTDEMRVRDLPLARRWRMETRRVFARYLQAGYQVVDFLPPTPRTGERCYYLLARRR
jgi:predicted GNAT superfamily acetyltransferase